jgi:DNA-binding GntR family transcriptional regulator
MQYLSLKEIAYRSIKDKILSGDYHPGMRLREDLLAEEISMSRTPVREAINQLAAEGLVTNIARKGIYLAEFDGAQIQDLLEVRQALEVLAVSRCVSRIDGAGLDALEANLRQFSTALDQGRYGDCNQLDSAFHQIIAASSGNSKLVAFLAEIEDAMQMARAIEKKADPQQKNQLTLTEHRQIVDAIAGRDTAGAIAAVQANLNRMRHNLHLSAIEEGS